ncbi:MAG: hypothetical protein ACRDG3_00135 [Tepidiformaceae bacterium]
MPAPPVPITGFLRDEGFGDAMSQLRAREILEAGGLTNPRKHAMDASKLPRARALLGKHVIRVCSSQCHSLAPPGREPLLVESDSRCQVCEGSNNRRAGLLFAAELRRRGGSKLLVVGGTPANHQELQQLLAPAGVAVRCIDGASSTPSQKEAWAGERWADLTVIWATTPLPHKVSLLYTGEPQGRAPVTVARRGIEALCNELRTSLERHGLGDGRRTEGARGRRIE